MKNKFLPVLFAFVVLFATNQASAYYSPSTGRWLSRDPSGELGFETLRASGVVPRIGQVVSTASLPQSRLFVRDSIAAKNEPNRYAFVQNAPIGKIDIFGLLVDSGVRICDEATWGLGYHEWIEYPGGSAGFWPGASGIWPGGPGTIQSPHDPHTDDPDSKEVAY